jgi:hypothetical protein
MREGSINMAETIVFTTRKGDTLEPGTPSQALSDRNTANARIMAETISNSPTGHSVGHSRNLADRAVFHFKESEDCIKWCNRVRTRNSRKSATPRFFLLTIKTH